MTSGKEDGKLALKRGEVSLEARTTECRLAVRDRAVPGLWMFWKRRWVKKAEKKAGVNGRGPAGVCENRLHQREEVKNAENSKKLGRKTECERLGTGCAASAARRCVLELLCTIAKGEKGICGGEKGKKAGWKPGSGWGHKFQKRAHPTIWGAH